MLEILPYTFAKAAFPLGFSIALSLRVSQFFRDSSSNVILERSPLVNSRARQTVQRVVYAAQASRIVRLSCGIPGPARGHHCCPSQRYSEGTQRGTYPVRLTKTAFVAG